METSVDYSELSKNHNYIPNNQNKPHHNNNSKYKHYIVKSALFLSLITLIGICNNLPTNNNTLLPSKSFTCLYDLGIQATERISLQISHNEPLRKTLLIISSACIDLTAISVMVLWIYCGKSWNFLFTLFNFYFFRMFIQFIYNMPFVKLFTFGPTGVPSLMVSYLKTNDYFYSGHVALPLICAMEFRRQNLGFVLYICIFISLYEAFVMISTGAHYLVDVVIGWVCAFYFDRITQNYIHAVDNSSISINEDFVNIGSNEDGWKWHVAFPYKNEL